MTRKRITLLGLVTIAGAVVLGAATHSLWAAPPRPLPIPPKIIASKFKPDPVLVDDRAIAHLTGVATPPEKVDVESLVSLTWTWHIDKVQFKTGASGTFAIAPPKTYEAAITSGSTLDANAVLILRPRHAGFWKVTVHATATYANVDGEVFTGNSEPKDLFLAAADKTDAPTSQSAGGIPPQPLQPQK